MELQLGIFKFQGHHGTYIQSEKNQNMDPPPLIWQGETKFQMLLGMGRRPTVYGFRPTKPPWSG